MGAEATDEGARGNRVRSWRPELPGVVEVFHAEYADHRYPAHSHDTWTVVLVDEGAIRYELEQRDRVVDRGWLAVLPPHLAHDGMSARPGRGFRKRVLYLDGELLDEGLVGPSVDRRAGDDPPLRALASRLHRRLLDQPDDLEPDAMLALLVERLETRLGAADRTPAPRPDAAEALRARLDADPFSRHRLADAAAALGWSAGHLTRSFSANFGLPPHRYLVGRRIDEARRRLLDGMPPAEVAAAVGFHDQAHLSRHFTRHLAVTPARFQRSGGRRPTGRVTDQPPGWGRDR